MLKAADEPRPASGSCAGGRYLARLAERAAQGHVELDGLAALSRDAAEIA